MWAERGRSSAKTGPFRPSWRVMSVLLALCLALSGCGAPLPRPSEPASSVPAAVSSAPPAQEAPPGDAEPEQTAAPDASAPAQPEGTLREATAQPGPGTVLLFASDFQHRDGWEDPPVTLNKVLDAVYDAGVKPDNFIFCGDYTAKDGKNNYNSDPHASVEEIRRIYAAHDAALDNEQLIFVQGNHDLLTTDLSTAGLHEFEDYLVYVLNTETEYPWGQGKYGRGELVRCGAERLEHCLGVLARRGETRPIFLAGHVPLHFSGRTSPLQGTGDNVYARELFRVVQEAGTQLNLVYLYGHNHSRGWDSYLGGSCVFREAGDELLVPDPEEGETDTARYTVEELSFTYLNAGYVGYFSSAGGEDALTCTVCELWPDRLVFTRYDEFGVHQLSSVGARNPAKDDRALIGPEHYGSVVFSPHEVLLRNGADAQLRSAA